MSGQRFVLHFVSWGDDRSETHVLVECGLVPLLRARHLCRCGVEFALYHLEGVTFELYRGEPRGIDIRNGRGIPNDDVTWVFNQYEVE